MGFTLRYSRDETLRRLIKSPSFTRDITFIIYIQHSLLLFKPVARTRRLFVSNLPCFDSPTSTDLITLPPQATKLISSRILRFSYILFKTNVLTRCAKKIFIIMKLLMNFFFPSLCLFPKKKYTCRNNNNEKHTRLKIIIQGFLYFSLLSLL